MIELSNERIDQILHEETVKKEEPGVILRSIYTRYMRLYEKYLSNIDELNDAEIAEMRDYHEETMSLVKYYYMDIPHDVCKGLREFDDKYVAKQLGPEWQKVLFNKFDNFKGWIGNENKEEERLKEDFKKYSLEEFYDTMDFIFREDFGTESKAAKSVTSGLTGLLFGKKGKGK